MIMDKILFINACVRPCSRTLELAKTLLQRLKGEILEVRLQEMPMVALDLNGLEKRDQAAHNYKSHFGRLSELQAGDIVVFTDINNIEHYYEVVLLETLPKNATKEMITSGFDLSLYTCTPGGSNRVTVRCNAAQDSNR